jgi:uncharacterized protein YjhX (UPF0386 family)
MEVNFLVVSFEWGMVSLKKLFRTLHSLAQTWFMASERCNVHSSVYEALTKNMVKSHQGAPHSLSSGVSVIRSKVEPLSVYCFRAYKIELCINLSMT